SPLRTGAARMALGAAALIGHAFPIIPVGLVYRDKDRFRSDALFLSGLPIEWSDLEKSSEDDADAVRELTRRIDGGLHAVTINLDQWEDAPIVECAEAIYASELGLPRNAAERFERTRQIARSLRRLRTSATEAVDPLYRSVVDYARLMKELHLRPHDLTLTPARFTIARWVVNKLTFLLLATPLLVVARIVFFVPYEITGRVGSRRKYSEDVRATLKLLGGGVLHLLWIVAISIAVGENFGWRFAPVAFLLLALLGFASIFLSDRWYRTFAQAQRFLLLNRRESLRSRLLKRRADLAGQLEELRLRLLERKQ
ncbi:MAG TPA: hypothetical protein VHL58_02545, partial [Thermoanaerobaculia bacterium]|nr:hypothetical protein [Thermoanaerobaculia bacterium]